MTTAPLTPPSTGATPVILREARLLGRSGVHDLTVSDGRVADVRPAGLASWSGPSGDAEEVRLDGRLVAPGLWDGHVHFTQWVVRRERIDLTDTTSAADCVAVMRAAIASVSADVVVGYGFRDALWPDLPTRAALDGVSADRPVILISRDLHCGWLNAAAGRRYGVTLPDDGVLRESAWIGVLGVHDAAGLPATSSYAAAAADAARRGVVGVVEFENADNATLWPARVAAGVDSLRVEGSVWPDRLDEAIARGLRTGDPLDERGLVTFGRLKIVVDGSLNTRTAACWAPYPGADPADPHAHGVLSVSPERLVELLHRGQENGILPAVHAIGDRAATHVIDAFERFGIPGVVEHAQLLTPDDFTRFGRLGLVASVQPEHAMDDRDVAELIWPGRTDRAFAYRSLFESGAGMQLGSDAPVSPLDPWAAISSAVSRERDGRASWHPEQTLPLDLALSASMRGRTTVGAGDVADLIVLDDDPLTASAAGLREMSVAATMLGGRWTHDTLGGTI